MRDTGAAPVFVPQGVANRRERGSNLKTPTKATGWRKDSGRKLLALKKLSMFWRKIWMCMFYWETFKIWGFYWKKSVLQQVNRLGERSPSGKTYCTVPIKTLRRNWKHFPEGWASLPREGDMAPVPPSPHPTQPGTAPADMQLLL